MFPTVCHVYLSDAPLSAFSPAAAMVYTDIQTLRGLDKPADYGSGVEYADGIINSLFPGEQVGLQVSRNRKAHVSQ